MIKITFLLRRKPGLTHEEFIARWNGAHAALARRFSDKLGMSSYAQVHPLVHPIADMIRDSRGSLASDFDGITEVTWDSMEDAMNVGATDAGIAAEVLADEAEFVDLKNSVMFFGTYHPIIGN